MIENLVEENRPFALVVYYDFIKRLQGEDDRVFEILTIKRTGKFTKLGKEKKEVGVIENYLVPQNEVDSVLEIESRGILSKVMSSPSGQVFEFANFGILKDRMHTNKKQFLKEQI